MKKVLWIILFFVGLNIAVFLLLPQTSPFTKKQTIHIAVVGPMSGKDRGRGQSMLNGIRLYLDKVKKEGILANKKIELVLFNDRKDRRTALKIASQLAEQDRVLLVVGHYYSSSAEIIHIC